MNHYDSFNNGARGCLFHQKYHLTRSILQKKLRRKRDYSIRGEDGCVPWIVPL